VKKPQWFTEEVAKIGQLVLDGSSSREDAIGVLAARVRAHPEYIADLITADAGRELSAWLKDNAPAASSSPQLPLFPELPGRMRVAPTRWAPVASMDASQLDKAKHMLMARTQNAMDGAREAAEHERKVFTEFYDQVRPYLHGDLTVADVLDQIEAAA
jgi:hypothetical protein